MAEAHDQETRLKPAIDYMVLHLSHALKHVANRTTRLRRAGGLISL